LSSTSDPSSARLTHHAVPISPVTLASAVMSPCCRASTRRWRGSRKRSSQWRGAEMLVVDEDLRARGIRGRTISPAEGGGNYRRSHQGAGYLEALETAPRWRASGSPPAQSIRVGFQANPSRTPEPGPSRRLYRSSTFSAEWAGCWGTGGSPCGGVGGLPLRGREKAAAATLPGAAPGLLRGQRRGSCGGSAGAVAGAAPGQLRGPGFWVALAEPAEVAPLETGDVTWQEPAILVRRRAAGFR
jgi:hypothetical protein